MNRGSWLLLDDDDLLTTTTDEKDNHVNHDTTLGVMVVHVCHDTTLGVSSCIIVHHDDGYFTGLIGSGGGL